MDSLLKNRSKQELIELLKKQEESHIQEQNRFRQEQSHIRQEFSHLQQEQSHLQHELSKLQQIKDQLQFQYDQLKRLVYGTKRERFIKKNNPFQQSLPFEEIEEEKTEEAEKQEVTYKRKKKRENHHGRLSLPSHLPVEEIIIEPSIDTTGMVCIGREITEQLELIPSRLFIKRTIRPKYVLSKEKQDKLIDQGNNTSPIIIADLPSMPIERCMAATGLLAQIFIDKFIDHLPYYRQIQRYKREGVEIKSSTIDGWQKQVTDLLEPLYERLKCKVLTQGYLQADESPVKVLDSSKRGKTHQGYHWVYHSPLEKALFFDYRYSRKRAGPEEILKDFKGYLQTDGYAAYNKFNNQKDITLVGCMAHARRYFDKALDNDKSRAEHALSEIQKLYAFERMAKENGYSHEKRHAYRLENAQPIMEELIKWLIREYSATTPKSPIGTAVRYAINQWESLRAYLFDGALEIDNNQIENAIRPLAIGRKNYLFAGSHQGARRAAMFYSFFGTCKKHEVNPYDWLKATLDVIADTKTSQLDDLLPQNFDPEKKNKSQN